MSDENFDPWQLLAADLGVDASKAATPPPPPAPTSQPRSTPASSSSPPPAQKQSSDWLALAGELGIELPTQADEPIKRHDPVADLLGFPPPAARIIDRSDEEQRAKRPRHERPRGRFEDRDAKSDSWEDEDSEVSSERELESTEVVQFEAVGESGEAPKPAGDSEERPRRRRRRGGRGRGRGRGDEKGSRDDRSRSDRGSRDQGERTRPVESKIDEDPWQEQPEDQPDVAHAGLDPDELRDAQEHAFAEAVEEAEERGEHYVPGASPDPDPRKRRRRRGRRGRGSRDRNEPRTDSRGERSTSTKPIADDAEAEEDSELHRGYADGMADFSEGDESVHEPVDVEAGVNGEDDSHHGDELHAKSSVRDIVTWKEAIGMIITGNMEARSRNPESSRGSHGGGRGSRGGRGRGRGGRGGGHRGG